jgi:hypothetical protein
MAGAGSSDAVRRSDSGKHQRGNTALADAAYGLADQFPLGRTGETVGE